MKTWIQLIAICCLFFTMSSSVSAHTDLTSTTPADGEEIIEPITEIALTYSGKIEEGSTFDIQNDQGEIVEVNEFTVMDGVLTGTLTSPLETGVYEVNWNSISEDGHPLNGTFSFTVNLPEETVTPVEQATTESSEQAAAVSSTTQTNESTTPSPLFWVLGLIAAVFVVVSVVMIAKRKRV